MIKYITTVLSCHVWPLYSTSQKFRTASQSLEWESVSKLLTGAVYIFAVQRQFLNWRSNWVFGWREAKVHPAVLIAETKPDPLSSTAKSDTESDRLSDLLFRLEVLHFRSWTTDSQPCFIFLSSSGFPFDSRFILLFSDTWQAFLWIHLYHKPEYLSISIDYYSRLFISTFRSEPYSISVFY